jgi:SAM-dependent methyltransferase
LELGCGTGFFTSVIAKSLPTVTGVAIDGSEAMLAEAATALSQYSGRLELRERLFSKIPWGSLGKFDLVFSAFAIHHLDDAVKQWLYQEASSCLLPKGCFVLFDSFRPYGRMADKLLEHLTCLDILRRHKQNTGKDVALAKVIETDRRKKLEQGDKESSLEFTLRALTKANLSDVAVVFAEARLAGLVAFRH